MRVEPPPATNSVPEAQPPPICMPTPNRNAPSAEARPIGRMFPWAFSPSAGPNAIIGKVSAQVRPISSICARRPAPRPSREKRRQAAVKPKLAW